MAGSTETFRAQLKPKPGGSKYVFGEPGLSGILEPMFDYNYPHGALVFPYTPNVTFGAKAEYEEYAFTHSIYKYNAYTRSAPSAIQISADFTAQDSFEAAYLLAVFHFLKSVSKSYFGTANSNLAGTPPPILLFDYLGKHMFQNVPVIITNYSYTLDAGVDYVATAPIDIIPNEDGTIPNEEVSYVPTQCNISIVLETQYNTRKVREDFDLDKFRTGQMLEGGDGGFV